MRLCRRSFIASTLAAVAAPALIRSAMADAAPVTMKLHHQFSAVSSVHDKFLLPWARQIAAQSGGRIRIDLFPSMQLGGAPAQLFDQVRDGTADIVWAMPSRTPGRFPRLEAFELPFVPSSRALVSSKAIQDYAEANAADEFRDLHPLCVSCSDRGVLHAGRPIYTIEDLSELRLHAPTRLTAAALHALGAIAVPMPNAELPIAIVQRVIQGCVDPWHMVPTYRLNDAFKNHTEFAGLSLSTTTFVLAMNKAVYEALPQDLKAVIDQNSGQAAATMAGAMWDLQATAVIDTVTAAGDPITTLLPESVEHWRRTTEPVLAMWLKEMKERRLDGGKLLASAHAMLAKYANEPAPQPPQASRPVQAPQPETPQAKIESTAAPQAPAPARPAASASSPPAAMPSPSVATPAPVASASPTAPAAPTAAATPPPPPVTQPLHAGVPAASGSPVVVPAAPPPPVVATTPAPPPARLAPPKTLDIPL